MHARWSLAIMLVALAPAWAGADEGQKPSATKRPNILFDAVAQKKKKAK